MPAKKKADEKEVLPIEQPIEEPVEYAQPEDEITEPEPILAPAREEDHEDDAEALEESEPELEQRVEYPNQVANPNYEAQEAEIIDATPPVASTGERPIANATPFRLPAVSA